MKRVDEGMLQDVGSGAHKVINKVADTVGGPVHSRFMSAARHGRRAGVLPKGSNPFHKGSSHVASGTKKSSLLKKGAAGAVLASPADAIAGAAGAVAGPAAAVGGVLATKALKLGTAGSLKKSADRDDKAGAYASKRLARGHGYHEDRILSYSEFIIEGKVTPDKIVDRAVAGNRAHHKAYGWDINNPRDTPEKFSANHGAAHKDNFGWAAAQGSAHSGLKEIEKLKSHWKKHGVKKANDVPSDHIERISHAIHKGWAGVAATHPNQTDEQKARRKKLILLGQKNALPEEEKEKDRVLARAYVKRHFEDS